MTDAPKTRRDELNALMDEMRQDEAAAVKELNDLFASDDMGALLGKLQELQGQTIPGGHYDQILGSTINVLNSTRMMAEQSKTIDHTMAQPAPAPEPAATATQIEAQPTE